MPPISEISPALKPATPAAALDKLMASATAGRWMDCGEGILNDPVTGKPLTLRVIEAEGWGRIAEVYDYSNEPDYNFRMLLLARNHLPALLKLARHAAILADDSNFPEACAVLPELEAVLDEARTAVREIEKAAQ